MPAASTTQRGLIQALAVRKYILAALALSVFAACGSAAAPRVSGHYTWGLEVESFTPCGSSKSFWVMGEPALLQRLRHKAADYYHATGKPYLPIYVEVSALQEPKDSDGFAADYDGVYRFTEVHTISLSTPAGCGPHG